jgi:hypothetical protein
LQDASRGTLAHQIAQHTQLLIQTYAMTARDPRFREVASTTHRLLYQLQLARQQLHGQAQSQVNSILPIALVPCAGFGREIFMDFPRNKQECPCLRGLWGSQGHGYTRSVFDNHLLDKLPSLSDALSLLRPAWVVGVYREMVALGQSLTTHYWTSCRPCLMR